MSMTFVNNEAGITLTVHERGLNIYRHRNVGIGQSLDLNADEAAAFSAMWHMSRSAAQVAQAYVQYGGDVQ